MRRHRRGGRMLNVEGEGRVGAVEGVAQLLCDVPRLHRQRLRRLLRGGRRLPLRSPAQHAPQHIDVGVLRQDESAALSIESPTIDRPAACLPLRVFACSAAALGGYSIIESQIGGIEAKTTVGFRFLDLAY